LNLKRDGRWIAGVLDRLYPGGSGIESLRQVLFAGGDAGAVPRASSDHYEFLPGVGRQGTQGLIENQCNRLAKVRQTFLAALALAIGARHFSALGHIPWAVSLDDRREGEAEPELL
jgi:hypothetical protein